MPEVILTTHRLRLRKIVPEDLDFIAEMLGDPEVMRFYPQTYDRSGAEVWLNRQLSRYEHHDCGLWLAEELSTGRPVGQVGLIRQEVEGTPEDEIGYLIHRPYWQQGFASEAAAGVRNYAFAMRGLARLISLVRPVNIPSLRTALRIGHKPERIAMFHDLEHFVMSQSRPQ